MEVFHVGRGKEKALVSERVLFFQTEATEDAEEGDDRKGVRERRKRGRRRGGRRRGDSTGWTWEGAAG